MSDQIALGIIKAGRILACVVLMCGISFAAKQPKTYDNCTALLNTEPFQLNTVEAINSVQDGLDKCTEIPMTAMARKRIAKFSFDLGIQLASIEYGKHDYAERSKNLEAMNALLKAYSEEKKTVAQLLDIQNDFAKEYDSLRTKFISHLSEDADYFTKLSRRHLEEASTPRTVIIHDDPPYRSPELMHIQQVPMPVTVNCTSFDVQGYTYTNCNQN